MMKRNEQSTQHTLMLARVRTQCHKNTYTICLYHLFTINLRYDYSLLEIRFSIRIIDNNCY